MGFCARCGHPHDPTLSFCAACGTPHAGPARDAGAVQHAPERPVGRAQAPGEVLLLLLVTLLVYGLFYWWRVSREVDAYAARPGHAHKPVRWGIVTMLVSLVAFLVGYGVLAARLLERHGPDLDPGVVRPEDLQGLEPFALLFLLGLAGTLVGFGFLLTGQWRVWSAIRDEEARRGVPSPLRPALMLLMTVLPYVSLVTLWFAYHRTQRGLNGMWAAASPEAASART